MRRTNTIRILLLLGLVVLLVSGCSWGAGKQEIDPPPAGADLDFGFDPDGLQLGDAATMGLTLYVKDHNGYVVPLSVNVPESETPARNALEYMVDGGMGQHLIPEGFQALLPKDTKVLGIDIIDKMAIVDFSEHFANYNAQDERKIIEAVTWTLTQFESIDKVRFWLEGETLAEMPVDGTPLSEPLTREIGVNLERSQGIHLSQASPVTLYFQSQLEDGTAYMVPVTRLVKYTEDIPLATLEALIQGPIRNGLEAVMMPTVKVLDVAVADDLITVDLDEAVLDGDNLAVDESMLSVILSLIESTGAESIKINVEGSSQVYSSNGNDYSSPVNRPVNVNKIDL